MDQLTRGTRFCNASFPLPSKDVTGKAAKSEVTSVVTFTTLLYCRIPLWNLWSKDHKNRIPNVLMYSSSRANMNIVTYTRCSWMFMFNIYHDNRLDWWLCIDCWSRDRYTDVFKNNLNSLSNDSLPRTQGTILNNKKKDRLDIYMILDSYCIFPNVIVL